MNKRERVVGESRIKVRNADETPKRWRTYLLMGVCLTLLVSGFFFAGRQHFSSMDYGMKNSKLRNEIIKLEAEKLRLVHTREVALSPGEIRKAAKKAGIIGTSDSTPVAQIASMTKEKAAPVAPNASSDSKPLIIKTAVVAPAKSDVQTAVLKTEKPARFVKKTTIAAE
ncbi:MAG: hypothetical protein IPO41_02305 [Acidobacteria bacterium]|nr:hypothetical protein [Acidobacteriota bacterium]MBK9527163.1 hypothetical protein [Acidobacteriota bacterium]MBP7476246.1 hypothetical protein [Pyrinomonadaceae bacterium]MBP9110104.1 hypothetical protein [Pyrinomonadaceae bacterium]